MKIYVDCTDTHLSRSNTGIQRVVRNVAAHAGALASTLGIECTPVVFQNGGFQPVGEINPPAVHGIKKSLRHRLLNHSREFGLAWILYAPLALLERARDRWLPRRSSVGEYLGLPMDQGDIFFLPDAAWCTHSLDELHKKGARIFLHDIIPITHPHLCNPGHVTTFQA